MSSSDPGISKQVNAMRHDLKMRWENQVTQAGDASMSFSYRRLQSCGSVALDGFAEVEQEWLTGSFAKFCCRVESAEQLIVIHNEAADAGLSVHLITDSGRLGFHGQPTQTCFVIGPDEAASIDEITGILELL